MERDAMGIINPGVPKLEGNKMSSTGPLMSMVSPEKNNEMDFRLMGKQRFEGGLRSGFKLKFDRSFKDRKIGTEDLDEIDRLTEVAIRKQIEEEKKKSQAEAQIKLNLENSKKMFERIQLKCFKKIEAKYLEASEDSGAVNADNIFQRSLKIR
jgi:hypothetical protein